MPPAPPRDQRAGGGGGNTAGTSAAAAATYWDMVGESFLPPKSAVPTLKERAAWVAAGSIDRAPEVTHGLGTDGLGPWLFFYF